MRQTAVPITNGPLSETEVARITDDLAHALRALGAPVRKDGLQKLVLGHVPVDALLWRFIHQALIAQSGSKQENDQGAARPLSEGWDRYNASTGDHPWVGGEAGEPAVGSHSSQSESGAADEDRPKLSTPANTHCDTNRLASARRGLRTDNQS